MAPLLNENEASIFLGITKELLYSFVKTGAKGAKLAVVKDKKNNFFDKTVLIEWDIFLHKPWVSTGSKKFPIPASIKEYLKVESGGQCTRCGVGHRLDNAHIVSWAESYSHHPHNLIRLCTDCHTKYDDGIISRSEIQQLKKEKIDKVKAGVMRETDLFEDEFYKPPNPIDKFIGRSNELNTLTELVNQHRFVLIEGIGGIGKTQLLLRLIKLKKLQVSWFNLDRYNSLSDFKFELTKSFGETSFSNLISILDTNKVILVLDGFENLLTNSQDETLDFIKKLYSYTSYARFIITSQVNISDLSINSGVLKIEKGLNKNESYNLLKVFIPSLDQKEKAITELIAFSQGHPLSLIIIAGLIQYYLNDPTKVSNTIKKSGSKILQHPKRKTQDKTSSLWISLTIAYEMIAEKQKWLLVFLAHFPVGCKIDWLSILSVGEKRQFENENELTIAISTLNQLNFIYYGTDVLGINRALMLNPIRHYLRDKARENSLNYAHQIRIEAYKMLMIEALILYDQHLLSEETPYVFARYEIEMPNYINAIKGSVHSAYCEECNKSSSKKEYLQIITGIAGGLYKFLFARGYFDYGIYFNQEGAKAHIELKEYGAAIDDLVQVAALYLRLYNYKEVSNILITLKQYEIKAKERFAVVCLIEGELLKKDDPHGAINKFNEGIEICQRELKKGESSSAKGNMAGLISETGRIYERNFHDYKTALIYYQKGYKIQKEMKDYTNMFCNSHHLGNCYAGIGDYKNAIKYYKESLEGFIQFGQQQYISNSLSELGSMRVRHSDLDFTFLTKEYLNAGLVDIETEIKAMLSSSYQNRDEHLYGGVHSQQVSKLWNIIKIVSLSRHSKLLGKWATEFIKYFKDNHNSEYISFSYPLFFLRIAKFSALVEKKPTNIKTIRNLKNICYLHGGEVEHDIYDPFEWLALWLNQKRIEENATRDKLFAEVENGYI